MTTPTVTTPTVTSPTVTSPTADPPPKDLPVATASRSRNAGTSPRTILLWVGIAVFAGLVVFAAFFMGDDEDQPTVAEVAGSPTIDGALQPLPDGADPEVGSPAPQVTGAGFDGEAVTIGEPGTPQMIVFMASWCPACRAELPEMVEWLDEGGLPDGVELVSVSTGLDDARDNWPPQRWFEREGYDGPILVDDAEGSVAQAYGLSATPFWVFVDAEGTVVGRAAGQVPADQLGQIAGQLAATAR
ncbi:TlpA family protein disulfide reductase [Nitriliruptoraceae bacterium ZYF776]|nr:TlpA family protein disulfide reductase [Profundirhabdus halotolerans]